MIHELKTIEPFFGEVYSGRKNFELRKNDRDYKVGDIVVLKQYNADKKHYCGPKVTMKIEYILSDAEKFGLMNGYCILGLTKD